MSYISRNRTYMKCRAKHPYRRRNRTETESRFHDMPIDPRHGTDSGPMRQDVCLLPRCYPHWIAEIKDSKSVPALLMMWWHQYHPSPRYRCELEYERSIDFHRLVQLIDSVSITEIQTVIDKDKDTQKGVHEPLLSNPSTSKLRLNAPSIRFLSSGFTIRVLINTCILVLVHRILVCARNI